MSQCPFLKSGFQLELTVYLADEVVLIFVFVVFSGEVIKNCARPPALNSKIMLSGLIWLSSLDLSSSS